MPLVDLPEGAQLDPLTPLPEGARLDQQPEAPSFWSRLAQAPGQAASSLAQGLSAAMQRTSPAVQQIGGKMNYQALGEAGPLDSGGIGWIDDSGMHKVDPTQHVILNDPTTGKPTVYLRNSEMTESVPMSASRIVAFGMTAPGMTPVASKTAAAGQALTTRFGGAETKAQSYLGNALKADVEAGGPGPSDILTKLTQTIDKPTAAVDYAGSNVQGLAGQVARMPGPGRQLVEDFMGSRDAGAGTRLAEATNRMAADGPSTFLAGQQLHEQAQTAAAPLYRASEMAPALNPDHLAEGGELRTLMGRPSMQQASRRALSIASEEGRDPTALGLTFDIAGSPKFEKVPSWRTLDYVKRGLDDVLETFRDKTIGVLRLDERGRAIDQTRRDYLALLDRENPTYAEARAAYSGPQQSRSALQRGSQIFNRNPDEIAAEIASLSPGDQQFYRLGAANALKTNLAKVSSGGDEARRIIGNDYMQQQLRAVFPQAQGLIDEAQIEKLMFGTKQKLLGGSQTAGRVAQDAPAGGGGFGDVARSVAEAGTAYMTNEPVMAAKGAYSAYTALRNWMRSGQMTPEVAGKVAEYLLAQDPQAAQAWLSKAIGQAQPAVRRGPLMVTPYVDLGSQQLMQGEYRR
jgi:hypothetical protein